MADEWQTFFFDSNACFGLIDSPVRWEWLIDNLVRCGQRGDAAACRTFVLDAKVADPDGVLATLPLSYFVGAMGVKDGTVLTFGYRREHVGGPFTLREWAARNGMLGRLAAVGSQ